MTQNDDGSVNLADAERFLPAERHQNLYAGKTIPHRPNYGRAPEGKAGLAAPDRNLPPLGAATATRDETILGRQRSLMAIEEGVGQIWQALKETGQLDNTLIVFTSDNGYFYGEHGLSVERRLAYEESIRMPLLVRYPEGRQAGHGARRARAEHRPRSDAAGTGGRRRAGLDARTLARAAARRGTSPRGAARS